MATVDSIKQAQALLNVLANQRAFLDELYAVKKEIENTDTTNIPISVTVKNALNNFGYSRNNPERYIDILNALINSTVGECDTNISRITELLKKGNG